MSFNLSQASSVSNYLVELSYQLLPNTKFGAFGVWGGGRKRSFSSVVKSSSLSIKTKQLTVPHIYMKIRTWTATNKWTTDQNHCRAFLPTLPDVTVCGFPAMTLKWPQTWWLIIQTYMHHYTMTGRAPVTLEFQGRGVYILLCAPGSCQGVTSPLLPSLTPLPPASLIRTLMSPTLGNPIQSPHQGPR